MTLTPLQLDRLPCQACGTWTCSACGWKRRGAALARPEKQDCPRCGGTDGTMMPTRHQAPGTWLEHNPADGPRCEGWEQLWASPGLPCGHGSCREISWGWI